jgi:predicted RND superfamily exporter protein
MLHAQGETMDTAGLEERLAKLAPSFQRASPLIVGVFTVVTILLASNLYLSPPTFQTDLNEFSPETEASLAHDRIHEHFPNEMRPFFVHVTADDGSNVLALEALKTMSEDLAHFQNESEKRQDFVTVWTTAPGILQLALDEEADGRSLASLNDWPEVLSLVFDDNETCGLTADDQLLSAATYASAALLHKDLDYDPVCDYLDDGSGTGIPSASSTLWVLEVDPDLEESVRRTLQHQLRGVFDERSEASALQYEVISNDLLAHDIDEGTFDNLLVLVGLAFVVVVIMLSVSFRSVNQVVFPLVGLTSALIWTYGILNLSGAVFTALEATVAPLVLGLGIDYAIHLQRSQRSASDEYPDMAESWLRSVGHLSVPLTLAVVTTVAAFLANIISPLPPLATLGYALSLGVVSAFVSSTVFVGALHVVFKKDIKEREDPPVLKLPQLSERIMRVQQKQQVGVLLVTILISGLAVYGAASLETDFDLADFVNEDLPIMTVRDELSSSYESAGWKVVYVLMEPAKGQVFIPGDHVLLTELNYFHSDLESNNDVVGVPTPSYEGPLPVIRDAILRNESLGEQFNLEVDRGEVLRIDRDEDLDLGAFFTALSSNTTVADPLTGETWQQRVEQVVHLNGDNIVNLRHEIRVEASTSVESSRVIDNFIEILGATDDSGTLKYQLKDHAQLHVTGDLVMLETVLDGLSLTQIESTLISLVVSFLVLFILTRRVMPAVTVLFPVGVASLWVVGSMALLGLKWNVLTVMVTALTLGIGIDYSIHMWRRFEVEMAKRGDHWEALHAALDTTGVALIMSALTTMAGFAVLLFSPMPIIQDFGLITAVTVLFSLVLALMLLPVLVELAARGQETETPE